MADYRCAGCGAPSDARAKTRCKCVTNVLFDIAGDAPNAAKDRYFMQQIDTNPAAWPDLARQREQNLTALRARETSQ